MEGHAKVAKLMSRHPELAIVRRFGQLNIQNLLYLQAELVHLEAEHRQLAEQDQSKSETADHAKDWFALSQSDVGDAGQWEKLLEIRAKLKEYNECFAQVALMSAQEEPNPYDLRFLRSWLERPKMGNFPILGPDQHVWAEENERDLAAIRRRRGDDIFTRWFIDTVVPLFHKKIGQRFKKPLPEEPESEISQYSESHLTAFVHILGTVLASLLPITSIVILFAAIQVVFVTVSTNGASTA
ncbi:hypothetical protein G7Y89_g11347 [Cudoniella acicularis]|uniref:DUF6594 domain-containing protein n=1 Tax=Cudoniella acicularis TaxID=354080 RepID=A0A8H4W073_9HELO|nr:hypothetical protein G7Y89_g11347 [Cudoniella acicularis]